MVGWFSVTLVDDFTVFCWLLGSDVVFRTMNNVVRAASSIDR